MGVKLSSPATIPILSECVLAPSNADKEKALQVYKRLLVLQDPDDPKQLDKRTFAEAMGISINALGGYITQLKRDAKTAELKALGYSEKQLPTWMSLTPPEPPARTKQQSSTTTPTTTPATTPTTPATTPAELKPEEKPAPVELPQEKTPVLAGQAGQVAGQVGQVAGQVAQLNKVGAPLNTGGNDVLKQLNRRLGPGGDRFEANGSNTLQDWMRDNAVEERDGEYWQRRKLDSSEMALVVVSPPKEVLEADAHAGYLEGLISGPPQVPHLPPSTLNDK